MSEEKSKSLTVSVNLVLNALGVALITLGTAVAGCVCDSGDCRQA